MTGQWAPRSGAVVAGQRCDHLASLAEAKARWLRSNDVIQRQSRARYYGVPESWGVCTFSACVADVQSDD
jgi:hypothetical protein